MDSSIAKEHFNKIINYAEKSKQMRPGETIGSAICLKTRTKYCRLGVPSLSCHKQGVVLRFLLVQTLLRSNYF